MIKNAKYNVNDPYKWKQIHLNDNREINFENKKQ